MVKKQRRAVLSFLAIAFIFLMIGSIVAELSMSNVKDKGVDGSSSTVINNDLGKESVTSTGSGIPATPTKLPDLIISPVRQITNNGKAEYKILFMDYHTLCGGNLCSADAAPSLYQGYNYKLSFSSLDSEDTGVQGSFDQSEFSLKPQSTFTTTLTVKTESEGAHNFVVSVKEVGDNYGASAKAVMIYLPNSQPEVSFFIGKGFILNNKESQGYLVDLTILNKENILSGKATIGQRTFKIRGEVLSSPAVFSEGEVTTPSLIALRGDVTGNGIIDVQDIVFLVNYLNKGGPAPNPLEIGDVNGDGLVDSEDLDYLTDYLFKNGPAPYGKDSDITVYPGKTYISFDLYSQLSTTSATTEEIVGSFRGYVKQLDNFKLLKGDLKNFNGEDWSLTAFGKKVGIAVPIEGETETTNVGEASTVAVNDVLIVGETSAESAMGQEAPTTEAESGIQNSGGVSEAEIYIRPLEIYQKKLLGFIPWGGKAVKIEVIKKDGVVTEAISENSKKVIEGYTVSVGSLENKENIELNIEKA